jgi:hypothetical protein
MLQDSTTGKDAQALVYLPPYTEKPRSATKETATMKSLLASSTAALSFIPRYIQMQTCPSRCTESKVAESTWSPNRKGAQNIISKKELHEYRK